MNRDQKSYQYSILNGLMNVTVSWPNQITAEEFGDVEREFMLHIPGIIRNVRASIWVPPPEPEEDHPTPWTGGWQTRGGWEIHDAMGQIVVTVEDKALAHMLVAAVNARSDEEPQ